MKILDYDIMSADTAEALVVKVQARIAEGWQPWGPHAAVLRKISGPDIEDGSASASVASLYTQAVVKFDGLSEPV